MELLIWLELPVGTGIVVRGLSATSNKKESLMKSKRMLIGAVVIGGVTAAMISGAWAQEATTHGRLNAHEHFNVRAGGNISNVRAGGNISATRHLNARQGGSANV